MDDVTRLSPTRNTEAAADSGVFVTHWQSLVRYATALVGPADAEDVVMTVVSRSLAGRGLSVLENPKAYLFQAVLNEARGWARRRRFLPLESELGVAPDSGMAEVLDVLMGLPVRQRAAVYLYYWESAPISEIARSMGVAPGTVKRYLFLARRKLQEVL